MAKVPVLLHEDCNDPLFVFEVWNTAHNTLYALAKDASVAIGIAQGANHVLDVWPRKDKSYPHAEVVREPFEGWMTRFSDLIELAKQKKKQGTLHFIGDELRLGWHLIGTVK